MTTTHTPALDGDDDELEARIVGLREVNADLLAALERAANFLEVQAEHYERSLRRCFPKDEHLYQNGAINYRAATTDARNAIARAKEEQG